MAAAAQNLLKPIYLAVFDNFALNTRDVAEQFKIDRKDAYDLLNILRARGLITGEVINGYRAPRGRRSNGGTPNPFQNLTWQCWETYDNIDRTAAEALYDDKMEK